MTIERRAIRLLTDHTGKHPGNDVVLPPSWTGKALCAQVDPARFFPATGENPAPAKDICGQCDVTVQCLEYALGFESQEYAYGVYGGLTAAERKRLIKSKRLNNEGMKR